MSDPSSVKKVAPYPIPLDVIKAEGQPPQKESIVKLTDIGFLMRVEADHFYKVGEDYSFHFQLPVLNIDVQAKGKIVKTYSNPREHLVEVHFKALGDRERSGIHTFLVKIGQTQKA
jgi:hypothetical protein